MRDPTRITVVFSGGGSGGHLYPALALVDALASLRPDVEPFFIGASRGVEADVLPGRGVAYALLPVEGFPRGGGLAGLRALPRLGISLLRVADIFQSVRPRAVVVTGGFAGGPAGIVAGLQRIPLVLQEQNSVPGVTNRLLSRWASQIHIAFPEAVDRLSPRARSRALLSGNPVRPPAVVDRADARRTLGVPEEGLLLLVSGGSQGSAALNRLVLDAVAEVAAGGLSVPRGLTLLWSTGRKHHGEVAAALSSGGSPSWLRVVPYLDDMPAALAATDFAVSRAGAMTTAELMNQGLPAILVPLPTAAADHQAHNAAVLEQGGAAMVAPEEGLTGPGLWNHVVALASDPDRRERMAAAARERARPTAAGDIAGHIARLLPTASPANPTRAKTPREAA